MDLITHLLAALAIVGIGLLFVSLPWALLFITSGASQWYRTHISHKPEEPDYGW